MRQEDRKTGRQRDGETDVFATIGFMVWNVVDHFIVNEKHSVRVVALQYSK